MKRLGRSHTAMHQGMLDLSCQTETGPLSLHDSVITEVAG